MTRLALAVEANNECAAKAAISAGADVNAVGRSGLCFLAWAMARDNVEGFCLLLHHGASWNNDYRDSRLLWGQSYRKSVLDVILKSDDRKWLKALLQCCAAADCPASPKVVSRLMFQAEMASSTTSLMTLIDAGADINCRDSSGYTPLVRSMMGCEYNTAWFLLSLGADPTIQDGRGETFADSLRRFGSRGVRDDHRESFENIVTELVKRGLITREEIAEADKRKDSAADSGPPGVTIIEHDPGSEAGQMILRLDAAEAEANQRDQR